MRPEARRRGLGAGAESDRMRGGDGVKAGGAFWRKAADHTCSDDVNGKTFHRSAAAQAPDNIEVEVVVGE
jgi:hypothetical protein